MDTEETLSPRESFELIARTIERTRENIRENSFYFQLWGWLIAIASLVFFVLQVFTDFAYYFIGFPILATLGCIVTVRHYARARQTSTETYLSYFLSRLWAVLGLSFLAVVFINVSQGAVPFTYTMLVAGMGTLVSGWVMKFRPLVAGGIIFFAAAITSIYVPEHYKSLLHAMAIVAGYLAPGYILKQSGS